MKRKQLIKEYEISKIFEFTLHGYPQKVAMEGKRKDLPIVLFLHGGPGTPIPFSVGCRGLFPDFTDNYLMVYWDQLGCGINNYVIDDTFTIDSFVQMTLDLIEEIKKLFPTNPFYIFATSWGSILSAKILEKKPGIVNGVIVSGQIIKDVFFHKEVLETLEKTKIQKKKLHHLREVTLDNYKPEDLAMISSCLQKYTNAYQNKKGEQAPMGKIIMGLMTSPDYGFRDFKAIVINGYRNNQSIWPEILRLDLSHTLRKVQIPYMILQGDTDIVASTQTVKEVVDGCDNPKLTYKVISNTGHLPGMAMMVELLIQLKEMTGK